MLVCFDIKFIRRDQNSVGMARLAEPVGHVSLGRVAQSVGHLTRKSGVLVSIPGLSEQT